MAEEVNNELLFGRQKILLFRKYDPNNQNQDAAELVFQTGHTFTYNRAIDRITTKRGAVIKVGGLEAEVPIEALQSKSDPTFNVLADSVKQGYKLELWEVTIDEELKEGEKYPAVYCRGYLDSWEIGSEAEDEGTVSSTFIVELVPQDGFTALTEAQQSAVQYAFQEATGGGEPTPPE